MQNTQIGIDANIQDLLIANYQRMVAFDQAAHLTQEEEMKDFYNSKAEESENNLKQLCACLNIDEDKAIAMASANNSPLSHLQPMVQNRKNSLGILNAVKLLEKSLIKWYRDSIAELKSLPNDIMEIIQGQFQSMVQGQLQLNNL